MLSVRLVGLGRMQPKYRSTGAPDRTGPFSRPDHWTTSGPLRSAPRKAGTAFEDEPLGDVEELCVAAPESTSADE